MRRVSDLFGQFAKRPPTSSERIETGPAVRAGKLRYVSVSQVQSFDPDSHGGCHRKWYFDKVVGLPRVETNAQKQGKAVHFEIEHYFKTGEDVLGALARPGKHLMPRRDHIDEMLFEHPIGTADAILHYERTPHVDIPDVLTAAQVPFIGYIDVVNGSGRYCNEEGDEVEDKVDIEVIDWKTSSSIQNYAKTSEGLKSSIQMLGYAKWVGQVFRGVDVVRLSHVYFQTRGPRIAEKRTTLIDLASVEKKWQHVDSLVAAMKDVAKAKDVGEVEANYDACEAYRGCDYRGRCPRSPEKLLMEAFGCIPTIKKKEEGVMNMGLLDRIKKSSTQADERVTKEVTVDPMIHERKTVLAVAATAESPREESTSKPVDLTAAVLPTDAPQSSEVARAAPLEPDNLILLPPSLRAKAQQHLDSALAESPKTESKPGKPGKPGKASKAAAAPAPEVEDVSTKQHEEEGREAMLPPEPVMVSCVAASEATSSEATSSETARDARSLAIYIDCHIEKLSSLPAKNITYSLEEYIERKASELAKAANVLDIRFAAGDNPLAYGRWRGALSMAVASDLPKPGVYTVNFISENELAQVVVQALKPYCTTFVRGSR